MNRDDLRERARQRLTYTIPNAARAKLHAAINDVFITAGKALAELLPVGTDSHAAIDSLGLARFEANAAVSHDTVSEEEAEARCLAAIPAGEVKVDPWPPAWEGALAAARRHRDRGVSDSATSCDHREVDTDRVMKPFLGLVVSSVDIDNNKTTIHTVDHSTGATIARWEGQGSVAEVAERMVEIRSKHGGLFVVDDSYAGRAIISLARARGLDVRSKIDGRVTHTPPASAVDLRVYPTDDVTLSDKTAAKKLKDDPEGLAEARPLMVAVAGATSGAITWSDMMDMTLAEFHALNRDLCEWQEEQLGLCRQGTDTAAPAEEVVDQATGNIADLIEAGVLVENTDGLARWQLEEKYDKLVARTKARAAAETRQRKPELAAMIEDVRHRGGWIVLHVDTLDEAIALSPENARRVAAHILGDPDQTFDQASDPGPEALDLALRQVVDKRIDAESFREGKDAWRAKAHRSHQAAIALWSLLDDIDTLDDRVKDDDVAYRVRARAIQKKREEVMKSDGFRLEYVGEYKLDKG